MPTGLPIADVVQAGAGAIQTAIGLINAGKTKREAERLAKTRPQYQISPLAGQDLALAKSDLAQGMSSAAETAFNNLNNSQFSSSLDAILKSGGTPNSIGEIYGNNQEGRLRLAQMKDQLRLQQIQNYVRANNAMQQEQQTQWQVNDFGPWQDRAQANAAARTGAQTQINNGLNAFGAGVANAGQALSENNQFKIPTGVNGGNNYGFNNGRATGITDYNIPTTQAPNVGGLPPIQMPRYNGGNYSYGGNNGFG